MIHPRRKSAACVRAPWRMPNIESLRSANHSFVAAVSFGLPATDVNKMAELYDTEIVRILDELVPARQVTRSTRPSDTWPSASCTRPLERVYTAADRRSSQCDDVTVVTSLALKWSNLRGTVASIYTVNCSTANGYGYSFRIKWRPE